LTITELKENVLVATRLDAFIPAYEKRHFHAVGDNTLFTFTIEFSSGWPVIGSLIDRLLSKFFAGPQADAEISLLLSHFNS